MAEETPQLPPPQVPIRGYTTPVNQEGFFSERVDYTASEYRIIPRGTKYSTILGADPDVIDQFAELYFLRETREIGSYPWAMRFWATDTLAEDTYNSSVEYVSEAVTFPAYTRVYTVRRDSYEASTTLPIGGTLTAIIAIKVIDGGQDYTQATITIDDSVGSDATAEAVIDVDGTIASIVVTNCGSRYTSVPTVTIVGDGGGAVAVAIIQPQTAYLVSQKKTEFPDEKQNTGGLAYMHPLKNEYVIITRIYETLPGPWVYSYKEDIDGALLTIKTRRNIGANITVEETVNGSAWQDVTAKGVDNFVSEETVESRSIVVDDTTAGTATKMTTSRVDEDGKTVTVTRAQASAAYLASITTRETISTGVWKRITSEPISHLKVWMIVETRVLPGNPVPSKKVDPDGIVVTIVSTLKDTTLITPSETLIAGVWTETTKEAVSDLVAKEMVMSRAIPGNAMTLTKIEEDGKVMTTSRTLADQSTIVSAEAIVGGVTWTRTYQEDPPVFRGFAIKGGDLVAWKIVESRPVPGNDIVKTVIDSDGDIMTETKTMVIGPPTLVTTITTSGGVWTKTFGEPISDLVSWKVVQVKATQSTMDSYEVSIHDLLPREFAAGLPVTTHEDTLIGTASLPTLVTGDLMRKQQQIDFNTYRLTVSGRAGIITPVTITNKEITSQFGGGDVTITLTLDLFNNLSLDEGLMVLSSEIIHIDDVTNGLSVLTSKIVDGSSWTQLESRLWDENMRKEYSELSQTVDAGSSEDTNPGVFAWVSEVKAIDKWKSKKINISKGTPDYVDESSALVSYDYRPFRFPGWLAFTGLGYYVRAAHADLCQQTIRTWWVQSTNPPVAPTVDQIIMDNPIISTLNNITTLAYAGECLHDAFTSFIILTWPATTPSMTVYTGTWIGTEKVIAATVTPEREKDIWKFQTRSVVMR